MADLAPLFQMGNFHEVLRRREAEGASPLRSFFFFIYNVYIYIYIYICDIVFFISPAWH